MSSPPPYPPTKTHSHPSRPVQVSPPPGSLLRSCHGTLQLPQHLTQHLQELSSYLASSWFFPCLSPAPLPASPCSKKGPAILSPFAGFYGCCFPCRCCRSSALGLCSGWTLPLHCPSPLTSWQIHSHPSRPSSKFSYKPTLPSTPIHILADSGSPVLLKCTQLCPCCHHGPFLPWV